MLILALFLAPLSTADLATDPQVLRAPSPARAAAHRVLHDRDPEGTLWSRGADWKAAFDRGGAEFTPYLGSTAPRNFPLRCAPPSVTVGGLPVALDTLAVPRRTADVVRFDRGSIAELYLLSTGGLEQQFVLERPLGAGEIVIRIPVETELEPVVQGAELRFGNALGGVIYGGATAIDAAGRATPLVRSYDAGTIVIEVPSSLAREAAYPLTIDPLMSAFGVWSGSAREESSPDVAVDAASGLYLIVTQVPFSAADHDVLAVLVDREGTPVPGSEVAVDLTSAYWATPRCASVGFGSQFGIAAAVGLPGSGARQIACRVLSAGALSTTLFVSDADEPDASAPDIGGCDQSFVPAQRFLVVWESRDGSGDADIRARQVRVDGTPNSAVLAVAVDPAQHDERPQVSSGSFSGEHDVVWQRRLAAQDHDIMAARIGIDATLLVPPTALTVGIEDDTNPAISSPAAGAGIGVGRMVAFERDAGGQRNVVAARLAPNQVLENAVEVSLLDPASEPFDQFAPMIEVDGQQHVLAWCEFDGSRTLVRVAEFHSCVFEPVLGGVTRALASTAASEARELRVAGRIVPLGVPQGALLVWTDSEPGAPRDLFAARWVAEAGVPPRAYCFGDGSGTGCPCGHVGSAGRGCPNSVNPAGALLATLGVAALLEETLVLQGSGMPPNTSCLYFQGQFALAQTFGDGLRCAGGPVLRLGTKLNSAGGSSTYPGPADLPVSVRGGVPALGGRRHYQVWYRNAASFCTSATFNLSNGVEVCWVPR
ncbi:MAG: hypothetical protein JNK02_03700 [Planctomycetes bacterium]|nr:hypothetical protein [Planctomycetota bacterium]